MEKIFHDFRMFKVLYDFNIQETFDFMDEYYTQFLNDYELEEYKELKKLLRF